jgi:hypothetical protein
MKGEPRLVAAPATVSNVLRETRGASGTMVAHFGASGSSGFGKALDRLGADVPASTVIEEGKMCDDGPSRAGPAARVGSLESGRPQITGKAAEKSLFPSAGKCPLGER